METYWIDGIEETLTAEEAQLFDVSNPRTIGVFETLRTYDGEIFKLDEHLARLEHSAKLLRFDLPVSIQDIGAFLKKAVEENPTHLANPSELRLKCVATSEHVYIQTMPLLIDPSIYKGVPVISVMSTRRQPTAKALPYNKSFEAHTLARKQGAYEAILVDKKGEVTEGAYSNIFWVKDGKIYTRKEGVLEGITRKVVLDLVPVKFQNILLEELKKVDELFLTKTTTGPVPITSIDGHLIADGKPGERTRELIQLFKRKVFKEF